MCSEQTTSERKGEREKVSALLVAGIDVCMLVWLGLNVTSI